MFDDLKKLIAGRYALKYLRMAFTKVWELASGKKTYIVALILILDGSGDFLMGEIKPDEFFDMIWKAGLIMASGHKAEKILEEMKIGNHLKKVPGSGVE